MKVCGRGNECSSPSLFFPNANIFLNLCSNSMFYTSWALIKGGEYTSSLVPKAAPITEAPKQTICRCVAPFTLQTEFNITASNAAWRETLAFPIAHPVLTSKEGKGQRVFTATGWVPCFAFISTRGNHRMITGCCSPNSSQGKQRICPWPGKQLQAVLSGSVWYKDSKDIWERSAL